MASKNIHHRLYVLVRKNLEFISNKHGPNRSLEQWLEPSLNTSTTLRGGNKTYNNQNGHTKCEQS